MILDFADEKGVQVIVATHAPDFIAEMPVESLVWIDRGQQEARQANKLGQVLADLGSVSSAEAVRAYGADKILFVEGSLDRRALEQLLGPYCTTNPFNDSTLLIASLPNGKGDVRHLGSFKSFLWEAFSLAVRIAAIVDNDFDLPQFSPDETPSPDEPLTVPLPRKEIENFFIEPSVFARALGAVAAERRRFTSNDVAVPDEGEIKREIDRLLLTPEFRDAVKWQVVHRYESTLDRKLNESTRREKGESWFESKWNDSAWRIRNCRGKKALSAMRRWAQTKYSLTVSNAALCKACSDAETGLKRTAEIILRHLYEEAKEVR